MPPFDATIESLAAGLPPKGRLLGLDLGTKTIGLALSDVERRIASPLETIRRTKFPADAGALMKRVRDFEICGLIVGLPLELDGKAGPRAQATRAFMRNLASLVPPPHAYWDERFSTALVTRELIAQDASRAKRAQVVDRMAAAYILQGALDRLGRLQG